MKTDMEPSSAAESPWARALRHHRLGYPDVHIVRFLSSIPAATTQVRRGIDVGFGSGQHLRTLAEFGYETWGTELLAAEVSRLSAALSGELRGGRLLHGHLDALPELKGQFDVALAWGVACLVRPSRLVAWLSEFRRLLKPGGRACLNFRTQHNWFHGLGAQVEPNCYLLDERAGPYAGASFTFFDAPEFREALLSADFVVENLEREDWWKNNCSEHHSWWIARVRNEQS